MNKYYLHKTLSSVAALGFLVAAVSVVLYFMELPIFNYIDLAWIFFYGLLSFAIAVVLLILIAIWSD